MEDVRNCIIIEQIKVDADNSKLDINLGTNLKKLEVIGMLQVVLDKERGAFQGNKTVKKHLDKLITDCEVSARVMNICRSLKAITLGDLTFFTEYDLLGHQHCGRKTLNQIYSLLNSHGLKLKQVA